MKLLILTQKVDKNDDVLGFFHDWIREFAFNCESVTVICLWQGVYDLPANVKILSLGKENGVSRFKYLWRFYKYIWQERRNYDMVLVHMNQVYVLLGGLFWRMRQKKIGLWYVHKSVNFSLRWAEKITDFIFTASPESCGLKSDKVKIVGHGIDTEKYRPASKTKDGDCKIIYTGRISPIKNQKLLIEAIDYLVNKKNIKNIKVDLVGGTIYQKDEEYLLELKKVIDEKKLNDYINFVGSVPNLQIVKHYQGADLSVNLCPTGGMDKAVLESMSCGVPVIVLNKTFADVLGDCARDCVLVDDDVLTLAGKINDFCLTPRADREMLGQKLRSIVRAKYNLAGLVKKIVENYE